MNPDHDIAVNTEGVCVLFTWHQLVIAWNPSAKRWHRVRCAIIQLNGDITVSGVGRRFSLKKNYPPDEKTRLLRNKKAREKWRKTQELAKTSCKPQEALVHP